MTKKTSKKTKTAPTSKKQGKKSSHAKQDPRTTLLLRTLRDIPFDGWTEEMLHKAAKKAGLSAAETKTLFPAGIASLLDYFSFWADEEAVKRITPRRLEDMRIRERIAALTEARIRVLMPYKDSIKMALGTLARSPQGLLLPKRIWRTADLFWYTAGDTSTDYNHYTKRLLLSGVLVSTMLYWLNDDSDDAKKTWDFLHQRIENVLSIGKIVGRFSARKKA